MNNQNRMKKLDETSYQQNGVIIEFEDSDDDLYSFKIQEDEETTKKLIGSVKQKQVPEVSFWPCAKALFAIIEKGEFPQLISAEELEEMTERFFLKFDEDPNFEIKKVGSAHKPMFTAEIDNLGLDIFFHPKKGSGRTVDEAKAQCLKSFFQALTENPISY